MQYLKLIWWSIVVGAIFPLAYIGLLEMAYTSEALPYEIYSGIGLLVLSLLMLPGHLLLKPIPSDPAFSAAHATGWVFWRDLSCQLGFNIVGFFVLIYLSWRIFSAILKRAPKTR